MSLNLSPTQVAFNARGDGSFNKPFAEQVDFIGQKLNLPTERYDDILKAAHDRAFVVAGAMKADLLTDLRQAVDKAIAEGKSIQWFRKEFDSIVAKHGWTGWTGEGSKEGRDWRTRVIYRTNLSASYAAGRWQQLNDPDLLKRRPYWKYIHNDTVRHPRPLHQSWSGMVLKHDDPFWQTHFPPNGWGCRCRVTAVRPEEYKGHPAPDDGTYTVKDRNGNEHTVPQGIDYGWDYAPGKTWWPTFDKYDFPIARQIVNDYADDGVMRRWYDKLTYQVKTWKQEERFAGKNGDDLVKAIRAVGIIPKESLPMAVISPEVKNLLGTERQAVFVSADTLVKQIIKRENQLLAVDNYERLQAILDSAQVITPHGNNKAIYWAMNDKIWKAVIKVTVAKDEVFLVSLHQTNPKEVRAEVPKSDWEKLGVA